MSVSYMEARTENMREVIVMISNPSIDLMTNHGAFLLDLAGVENGNAMQVCAVVRQEPVDQHYHRLDQ